MSSAQYRMGKLTSAAKRRGHTMPRAPLISLDQPGWLRVANLLAVLNISHSSLYAGLKPRAGETTTRYPKPDGNDGRPYWLTSTIFAFIHGQSPCNSIA